LVRADKSLEVFMANVVFMGTPDFAVPALRLLLQHHTVLGVVTQPDRPAGRSRQVQMSPVKQVALEAGIPVLQPEKIRRPEAIDALRQWSPDVYVVAAFGQILPQTVLDIPAHGSINIHASLLPRWRGAAPIQAAIRAGDSETGITIMKMDAGLDTGPMLRQRAIPITSADTGQTVHDKLAELGGALLVETLPDYLNGDLQPQPQDDSLATFAPRIQKEDGAIDWTQPAIVIERTVRAFTPWPGTHTVWNGKQLKIHAGDVGDGSAKPGHVMESAGRIAVGTGEGLFFPARVQLEGKSAVSIDDFVRGHGGFVGSTLG
jgi:methionyl-tRNA formyltransferase